MSSSSPSPSGSESGSFAEPMKRSPNVGTTTYNTGTQGDRAPMTNIGGFISPGKGEEYENYGERESEARRLMYSPFSMGHMGILNGGRGSSPFVDFCATSLSPLHAPLFSPAPPNANLSLFTSPGVMRGQWKGPHIFSPEVDNTPEREEGYLGYQPIGRSLRKLDFSKPLFYNPPTPNKLNTPHVNDPNPQYLPSSHLHYVRESEEEEEEEQSSDKENNVNMNQEQPSFPASRSLNNITLKEDKIEQPKRSTTEIKGKRKGNSKYNSIPHRAHSMSFGGSMEQTPKSLKVRGENEILPTPSIGGREITSTKTCVCNCKKSGCLKLYCECFARGLFCTGCNCINCGNTRENESEREAIMQSTSERNPDAFQPKIGFAHEGGTRPLPVKHCRGCHCKKSGCLKKYCECYQSGVPCTDLCKCEACKNCASHSHPHPHTQTHNESMCRKRFKESPGEYEVENESYKECGLVEESIKSLKVERRNMRIGISPESIILSNRQECTGRISKEGEYSTPIIGLQSYLTSPPAFTPSPYKWPSIQIRPNIEKSNIEEEKLDVGVGAEVCKEICKEICKEVKEEVKEEKEGGRRLLPSRKRKSIEGAYPKAGTRGKKPTSRKALFSNPPH